MKKLNARYIAITLIQALAQHSLSELRTLSSLPQSTPAAPNSPTSDWWKTARHIKACFVLDALLRLLKFGVRSSSVRPCHKEDTLQLVVPNHRGLLSPLSRSSGVPLSSRACTQLSEPTQLDRSAASA